MAKKGPIFFREDRGHEIVLTLNPELSKEERLSISQLLSVLLRRSGMLTMAEQDTILFYEMPPGIPHFVEYNGHRIFVGIYLNEKQLEPWATELAELRKAMADGLGKNLGQNGNKSGVNQNVGISTTPDGGPNSVQPCATFPKDSPMQRKIINEIMGRIVPQIGHKFMPREAIEIAQATYDYNASFGNGHEDNIFSTSIQGNASTLTEAGFDEIPDATEVHIDRGDHTESLTFAFGLSNLDDDTFPGYFIQTALGLYTVSATNSLVIFPGWLPHKPIAPSKYQPQSVRYQPSAHIPAPPSDMRKLRMVVVNYPNKTARTKPEAFRASMFKDEARMVWGTKRNQQEYEARQAAKKLREEMVMDFASNVEDDIQLREAYAREIQTKYKWIEDGKEEFPRLEKITATLVASKNLSLIQNHKLVTDAITCGRGFAGNLRRGVVTWLGGEMGIFNDGNPVPASSLTKPPPQNIHKKRKTKAERRRIAEGPLRYENLTCAVLREELKNRSLTATGLKSVLVTRLQSDDAKANRSVEALRPETHLPPRRRRPRVPPVVVESFEEKTRVAGEGKVSVGEGKVSEEEEGIPEGKEKHGGGNKNLSGGSEVIAAEEPVVSEEKSS